MSTVAQTESSDDMSAMTTKAMQKERTKEDIQKYFESQKNIFKFAVCSKFILNEHHVSDILLYLDIAFPDIHYFMFDVTKSVA